MKCRGGLGQKLCAARSGSSTPLQTGSEAAHRFRQLVKKVVVLDGVGVEDVRPSGSRDPRGAAALLSASAWLTSEKARIEPDRTRTGTGEAGPRQRSRSPTARTVASAVNPSTSI